MCFGSPPPPSAPRNPAPYSLDNSQSAVTETTTPATSEDMAKLQPEATTPTTPVRTANTGIYYKQG